MTPEQYKTKIFALIDKMQETDSQAERTPIADELKELIEALLPV